MSWVITGSEKTPVDPQFGSVSLLLHGDGADGSTTITDSSPSPKTVAAFGNAQISTAQSKFGGSSIAFDKSGDYLSVPSNSAFDFTSGNFTIESWIFPDTVSGTQSICATWTNQQFIFATLGSDLAFYWFPFSAGNPMLSAGSVVANEWQHAAISREGNTYRLFLDGVLLQTVNNSSVAGAFSANLFVGARPSSVGAPGAYFGGYIDDLRITKGVARYTANFTPPTAPFPDI